MRGQLCFYEAGNRRNLRHDRAFGHANGNILRNSAAQGWSSWPIDEVDALLGLEPNDDIPSFEAGPHLEESYEWMISNNESLGVVDISNSDPRGQILAVPQVAELPPPPASRVELPERPELLQLIDLFFEKFYRYCPIIHKETMVSAIESQGIDGVPPALLFAIVAVSAGAHPSPRIRQSRQTWYEEAKIRVSKEMQQPHHVLQTLQAAVLVIYLGLAFVDYSPCIVILGEAWRKTVSIGYNYGDSLRNLIVQTLNTHEKAKWIEKEEITRISWVLFIMDREICAPIGMMHAIDDRRMKTEFPMTEQAFQGAEEPTLPHRSRFTYSLDKLITVVRDESLQGSATQLQYLILAYALLGRITEALDHSNEDSEEPRKERLESLCAHLVRIRLMLPRSATELSMASYNEFLQVVWLNVVLNACTILLHHRALHEGESLDDPETEMATHWPHCVAAARNTISVLRDASRVSIEFVANAHFPALLFTNCRVLMTEYFCSSASRTVGDTNSSKTRDPKLREDLEVVAMTYVRMSEEWHGLGQKFSKGMYHYLHQGEEFAGKWKAGGAQTLVGACDTWVNIPDNHGITIPS